MSFIPEEERPKLKAKRFSKFESSTRISVADTLNDTGQERQRFKRKNEETFLQEVTQSKRKCSQFVTQPLATKNLANNRLQKLKDYLKDDLNQDSKKRAHTPEKVAYKIPLLGSSNGNNNRVGSSPIQQNNLFPTSVHQETSKNIYANLSKWAVPSLYTPVKNVFHHENNEKSQGSNHSIPERQAQGKNDPVCSTTHKGNYFGEQSSFSFSMPSKQTTPENNRISPSRSNYNEQDGQPACSPMYRYPNNNRETQNRPSHTKPIEHETTPIKQVSTEEMGKNIYKNLDKWASPPDGTSQKNLANSRLQRLKNVVKNLKPNANDPTSPNTPKKSPDTINSEQKYRSPLLRDKNTSLKRNRTEDDFTPESTSPKRIVMNPFAFGPSTKGESCFKNCGVAPTQLSERSSKEEVRNVSQSPIDSQCSDKKNNSSMFPSAENSDVTSTNLSHRTLRIKKNMAQISSALSEVNHSSVSNNPTSFGNKIGDKKGEASDSFHRKSSQEKNSNPSTPVSKRLNSGQNKLANTNTFSSNDNPPFSDFKLPFPSPQPQDTRSFQSRRPLAENSDNFSGKMAMTASWIRNHQNLNLTQSEAEGKAKLDTDSKKKVEKVEESLEDDTEEMEWANAEPDNEIVSSNQDIAQTHSNVEKQPEEVQKKAEKLQCLCIVVDTNVFISGLSKIKDIISMKVSGPIQPLLFIPWMVITELDFMKHDCSDDKLKQKVTNAIKFINTHLKEKNPRFIGQTVYEMDKQKFIGKSPDDKIMSCCLQAAEKYKTVILLSNDLNLKSKAMINGVTACSANEIIMKIVSKVTKNTKAQKVMQKMSILCSSVICECAKETYGDVWSKMDLLSNPPWSLVDCLKRFKKYWGSVFKEKLMKQFTKSVDDLLRLFNDNKYFGDDSEDFTSFMKLCVNLCIFLKDIEEFRGSVENTLTEITKLG